MKTYTLIPLAALLGAGTLTMAASEESGTAMHATGAMSAEAHIAQMETHLNAMKSEMDAISQVKDPVERRARYKKHLQEMTNMMHQMNEARPTMTATEKLALPFNKKS
jgi:hypothetical protein